MRTKRRCLAVMVCALALAVSTPGRGASTTTATSPAFGFNYNPLPADQAGTGVRFLAGATVAPLQTAVGAGSIHRFGIQWPEVERQQGVLDFGPVDARIGPLADAGLRLLPVVFNAPWWHRDIVDHLTCLGEIYGCVVPPADNALALTAWQTFVRQTVDHFSTGRYAGRLAGLEVWNEPNFSSYWRTLTGPDPVRFAHILCRSHAAVRAEDADLPVVLGGLIPWDEDGDGTDNPRGDTQSRTMRDFLNGVYGTHDAEAPDVRACMTALAVHNYGLGTPPDDPQAPFLDSLGDARRVMGEHDHEGRALWITEAGYGVGTADGDVPDELRQAEWNVCSYQLAAAQPDVEAYIHHSLVDIPDPGTFGHMGAYRFAADGSTIPRLYRDWFHQLFATYGASVPGVTSCTEAFRPA